MKKCCCRWVLIAGVFAAFAVWLEPTRVVWGWLRGEAFYQGRPTSWWAMELSRWDVHVLLVHGDFGGMKGCRRMVQHVREDSALDKVCKKLLRDESQPKAPGALTGDPAAEAVLAELVNYPVGQTRDMARYGLRRLGRLGAYLSEGDESTEDPP